MLTIGHIAKKSGLPAKTIRFYEEIGIIDAAVRAENGYRQYPETVVEELQLLKYVRDMGLPLSEIKKLMRGCENGDCEHSKEYIQSSIETFLHLLDQKLSQLQILRKRLELLHAKLGETTAECLEDVFCCNILHQLKDVPQEQPTRPISPERLSGSENEGR